MAQLLETGAEVQILCTAEIGAFPDERLVSIETYNGIISGFVSEADVHENPDGTTYLVGTIHGVEDDKIHVFLRGSFFTTTGIAMFSRKSMEQFA